MLRGMASSPPGQTIIYFLIFMQLRYITVQSFTILHHISHSHLFHWQLSTRYHENSLCLLSFFACSLRLYWYVLHSSYFTLFSLFFFFFLVCGGGVGGGGGVGVQHCQFTYEGELKNQIIFLFFKKTDHHHSLRAASHYFKNQEKYIILQ